MPIRTSSSAQPTTFVIMRGPSASSTIVSTYGSDSQNPGAWFWWVEMPSQGRRHACDTDRDQLPHRDRAAGAGGLGVFWNVSMWNPFLVAPLRIATASSIAAHAERRATRVRWRDAGE
jgi:hypothetical protein